jgi:hypothetical protein
MIYLNRLANVTPENAPEELALLVADLEEYELKDWVKFEGATVDDLLELAQIMLEEQIQPLVRSCRLEFGDCLDIETQRKRETLQRVIDLVEEAYNLNP